MSTKGEVKFNAKEQRALLASIDKKLSRKVNIVIIGGSALSLKYNSKHSTEDIDTYGRSGDIDSLLDYAQQMTGFEIAIQNAGVAYLPVNYKSRLVRILPECKKLIVFVPELHDFALSKIARSHENDLEAVDDLYSTGKLKEGVLFRRYFTEMEDLHGNQENLDYRFGYTMGKLYGQEARDRVEKEFRRRGR